uniref:RNA helicase n=1 Tax=Panagrolaimus sp. ES5 TaxID=591445 RepID=A0AC34FBL8_9BILA
MSEPDAAAETVNEEVVEKEEKVGFDIDEIPLHHILLFLPWIQKELPKERIHQLYEAFGMTEEQRDELIDSMAIKDGDAHMKDIFDAYYKIFCSDLKIARRIAKWFIQESKSSMAKRMLFDNIDPGAFRVYKKEFLENPTRPDIVPKLAAQLPVIEIADALKRHVTDQKYKEIAENAKEMYQKNSLASMWFARCTFLINFITVKPNARKPEYWLYEFFAACSYHPRTRVYPFYIDRDYQTRLDEYRIKLAAESAAPAQFTADLVSGEGPEKPRPQAEFGKKPSHVTGEASLSNYNLYKYQEELAGQAMEGKNCIICAPTDEYRIKLAAESAAPAQFTADLVSGEGPEKPRPQAEFGKKPSHVTGEASLSNYNLYKYQEELAGQAMEGKNCIICAPTGSGKTLVAVHIIADHLRKKRTLQQVGRAVLFVPTIPLVEQQSNYITEKIGTEYFITKMSGDERNKLATDRLVDIMAGDIIVMTPQIFVNMLSSPLKSQKIYLSDFTLMVFDECHHCNEGHPYNVVMNHVRGSKICPQIVGLTASTGSGKSKGGKINPEDTLNHIIALCARLMAVTISSVKIKQNVEDLLSKISQPVDDFIAVPPRSDDRFGHEIALISDFIEDRMYGDLKTLQKVILSLTDDQIRLFKEADAARNEYSLANGSSKTTVSYYSKLAWIKNEVEKRLHEMKDRRLYVLKCLSLLNMLYYALKYNELFPAELAMNYLEIRLDEFGVEDLFIGKENSCILSPEKLADLRELYENVRERVNDAKQFMKGSEEKPILTKLIEILQSEKPTSRVIVFVDMRKVGRKENSCILSPEKLADLRELYENVRERVNDAKQFMKGSEEKPILTKLIEILQSEKPTSRVIVFVDMRKVGSDLSKYLNKRPEIIESFGRNKVGYIASTNQASSRFGQTQAEQQMMLEKFKDGTINILVATSVAEEGLDVAACNLVLKYNSVGSEKALTQRKGRARAKGSKAILLALEEKTMRREFENVRKEVLMNICIQALQVMSEHELTRR